MKKIFLFLSLFLALSSQAQIISATDAAVLFSGDEHYGTARFEALSGAFGALGGDMSAAEINPAGIAVFLDNQSSMSLGYRKTDINTSFYGNNLNSNDQFINFSQAGGVLVFNLNDDEIWQKVALGFNYSIVNDFNNSFIMEGNSGTPDFLDDPFLNSDSDNTNDVFYNNVDGQSFINTTGGLNDKFTFSIGAQYNDKLFYGLSVSTYNLDYSQTADLAEFNNDGSGNTLDASLIQSLQTSGTGFSFGFGLIAKPVNSLRFGLAYHSPIWYNLTDFYTDDLQIDVSNNTELFTDVTDGVFDYKVSTPSIINGSFALLFGKSGLLSFDYAYKDYQNTKLRPSAVFATENQEMSTSLRGVSQYRIGAEWRLEMMSLRGGYFMEQNPYKDSPTDDDITGYSVGLGFKLSNRSKLDLAYTNTSYNQPYAFLQASDAGNLNVENQRVTATVVIGF
jgi:outer membrane protein transport protein (OMPP1/FadL/TodX)